MKRFLRDALYAHCRDYGESIEVYVYTQNDLNVTLGTLTQDKVMYPIHKALPLNDKLLRTFAYDIAFLAATKQQTFGAQFDKRVKGFYIQKINYPRELTTKDYIVHDRTRYNVHEIKKLEFGAGYFIMTTQAENELPGRHILARVKDHIQFSDEVEHE